MVSINLTANHALSITTIITLIIGKNVFQRHEILVSSIGAFPEEIKAYEQIKWMIGLSYMLLAFLTFIQIMSFYFYNGKFHPFSLIVMGEETSQESMSKKHETELQESISIRDFSFDATNEMTTESESSI